MLLHDERGVYQTHWGADGEWLVFRTPTFLAVGGTGGRDIMGFRPGVDSVALPLVATAAFEEAGPDLSPDGRWLAYSSNETGRGEVYVRPFPDVESGRVPISINGGRNPQWAHNGTELFFVDGQGRMVAAQVQTEPGFRVVSREPLFTLGAELYVPGDATDDFYDIAPDDNAFLMARSGGAVSSDDRPAINPCPELLRGVEAGGAGLREVAACDCRLEVTQIGYPIGGGYERNGRTPRHLHFDRARDLQRGEPRGDRREEDPPVRLVLRCSALRLHDSVADSGW